MEFTPRHAQPFTLEQAMMLEIDVLVAGKWLSLFTLIEPSHSFHRLCPVQRPHRQTEIKRLENSIKHLLATQDELAAFLQDPSADEDGEIAQAKDENDVVISSQRERIALIKVALVNKLGEGGAKHYGLETSTSPLISPGPTANSTGPTPAISTPSMSQSQTDSAASTQRSPPPPAESDQGLHL
ncbi:hypothetical protein DB88DRAFT_507396 [Papiliotrema laurentii]|uniref:Uncharacterized protein n=1 Tax=Papiliotrema laurentii TaxID=5418 RepID=A0AAD9FW12_PAPLA|nr:hypothetical protein DB88DRAFT_507396 [Papiliotrema laurentii]